MDQSSRNGARWLVAVGLALAGAGAVFTVYLWRTWEEAEATRQWIATPAQVLTSQVIEERATPNSPPKHRVKVRYEYVHDHRKFVSERVKGSPIVKVDRDDALAIQQQYVPRQQVTCYVNPAAPEVAILLHGSRAGLYSIWFPLLFFFGGLRMAWAALVKSRSQDSSRA